jgi:hypothetical protein
VRNTSDYPLTLNGTLAGLVAAALVGVVTDNLYAAYAAFVLLASVSVVWRRDDPPVLPFIFAYQWVAVTAGYWYEGVYGNFPGTYAPGDVERTMTIALSGLLLLAFGARATSQWIGGIGRGRVGEGTALESQRVTSIWPLFTLVMASYAVDYTYTLSAREFGGMSSLVQRILEFRQVLLVTLWLQILESRRNAGLLLVSFIWAVVPRLGTYYSDFKSPVLLMLLVLAATWRPWDARWWPKSIVAAVKAAPFVIVLMVLLLVWQGGLKRDTRIAHDEGAIGRDPGERISFFVSSFRTGLPDLFQNPEPYVEALVERVSYITFFSRVLEHVPGREPFADGELLKMAFVNAFVPRVLVPEKLELPSDSYYTRRFTGIQVTEAGTSISIGYMAEFYADWGLTGMYISILAYGCYIGLIAGLVRRLAAVPLMRYGAMIMVLLAVSDFEHQFIKGFASLNLNAGVTLLLLAVIGPQLTRFIGATQVPAPQTTGEPAEAALP